jgi:hypothetical protein
MKDNIKYIGIVDWFYDQIRNAKYGFVRHPLVGQHYFNENLIDQTEELSSFKEDAVVIFNSKESKHKKGSFEAYNVRLIENEIDLEKCLKLFKYKKKKNYNKNNYKNSHF